MAMTRASDLAFFDLDLFSRGTPHDAFGWLREHDPVSWHRLISGRRDDGFWLLTRHADICEVSKQPAIFYSHGGSVLVDAPGADVPPHVKMVRDGFSHLDPPQHTALRKLATPLFSPGGLARLESRIRERARHAVERAIERVEFDLVAELAAPYPSQFVYCDLLGIPADVLSRAVFWGSFFNRVHAVPPTDREFPAMIGQAATALQELHAYCRETLRSRREAPGDDVLSVLAHLRTSDGTPITDDQFTSYFWSLVTGAYDTTAAAIAGGLLTLAQQPAQRDRLYADASLVPQAVEEILRWETPVIYFRRTAAQDYELRDKTIRAGQRVAMCYAAANRDPEVFAEPHRFDVMRTPNPHLAFGYGAHFCLGTHLARLELRVLFEEIIAHELRFELRGPVVRSRSNFINRIETMPVTARRGRAR